MNLLSSAQLNSIQRCKRSNTAASGSTYRNLRNVRGSRVPHCVSRMSYRIKNMCHFSKHQTSEEILLQQQSPAPQRPYQKVHFETVQNSQLHHRLLCWRSRLACFKTRVTIDATKSINARSMYLRQLSSSSPWFRNNVSIPLQRERRLSAVRVQARLGLATYA